MGRAAAWIRTIAPGMALAAVIALAAQYLAEHYGGPAMLFALLIGMAFNGLAATEQAEPGIAFSAKTVLRLGVALLGVRITLGEIADLGLMTIALIVSGVTITILLGGVLGRAFGLTRDHAILSAGAVAICGASAALAIAAVLPRHGNAERNCILTVIGVTTLSTLAMMAYPLLPALLGYGDTQAGIFLGATIHDVAQVVGAGYTISPEAGETATVVKLLRVACLTPAVLLIGLAFRAQTKESGLKRPPLVPWFLAAFLILAALNSTGLLPVLVKTGVSEVSQWALLTAVAALGVRTSLRELAAVGPRPLLAMVAQTLLLALFVLACMEGLIH